MKRTLYISLLLLASNPRAYTQPYNNAEQAFAYSVQKNLPVLLIFSGSDWCLPCKRIEKNILTDTIFKKFARKELVTFIADFPQKKKLSVSQKASNEKLADEFNPKGIFPLLLLVKPDRTIVASLQYENYSASDFVKEINKILVSENMLQEQSAKAKLMGSAFEFIISAADQQSGNALLQDCIEEVKRLEKILTEFSENSDTALINQHAGISPVEVSSETYQLLQRCKHLSTLTDGAFDITSGILKKLYNFKQQDFVLPSASRIAAALGKTGYKKIKLLPGNRVFLEEKDMHIGFGAIGKGYAADMVKNLMQKKAVATGVINASGDLVAWGLRNSGEYWKAGIEDPDDPSRILLWLPMNEQAIATSGNTEQFFEIDGTRYSHNIDPKSGYPVKGIKSVSVISPSAELSDALATAVTVMGISAGLHFINQLPQTWCIVVDDHNKLHYSKKINVNAIA